MVKDVHWERERARYEVIRAALEVERTSSDAALAALRAAVREYRAVNNTRELLD